MTIRIIVLFAVLPIFTSHAQSQGIPDSFRIRLLPDRRAVRDFVADGEGHRFFAAAIMGSREAGIGVGGTLPWMDIVGFAVPVQIASGASIRAIRQNWTSAANFLESGTEMPGSEFPSNSDSAVNFLHVKNVQMRTIQ